jgi:glycosidase
MAKYPLFRTVIFCYVSALLIGCIHPPAAIPIPTAAPPPVEADSTPWWNDGVFYQIFVRSFADSDGDGNGDFNGLIGKLDYLNDGDPATHDDLGITAVWLMPIFPSLSYHGYDVTDYYNVNPDYGTRADFQQLVKEAHARGIHVVIDFVLNHTSPAHPWFQQAQTPDAPYRHWYVWSEDDPGQLGPWGQQVWHPSDSGYYYGVFSDQMPDLNYNNSEVVAEMDKVVTYWLTEMGVDGFRLDGARYLVEEGRTLADSEDTHAYFRHMRQRVKAINPNAMTVGEVWTGNNVVSKYAQGDQFDLAFNFDLAGALVESAASQRSDATRVGLDITLKLLPLAHTANFLTNHDQNRAMVKLGNDVNKAKRAATLLFTAPGTPFVYYGEEIGQLGEKPDEDIRLPMQWNGETHAGFSTGAPWRDPASDYPTKNVASQLADGNSLLAHYGALIRLRAAVPALRLGAGYRVDSADRAVLALLRQTDTQQVLVITNLSEEEIADYALKMKFGPFTAGTSYTPSAIWGDGPFASFIANEEGGFADFQPTERLIPGQTLVLELQKD